MMTSQTSDKFVHNVAAAVAYWQAATRDLDDTSIRQIDAERQNLLQAIKFGLTLPQTWEATTTVLLQAFDIAEQRGYWQEWIVLLQQAVAACPPQHLYKKSKLLNNLGKLHRLSTKMEEAIVCHRRAETIAHQLQDAHLIAETHFYFAEAYLRLHNYDKAEQHGLAALQQLAGLKNAELIAAGILNALGEVAYFRGDLIVAEERLSQAINLRLQLDRPVPLARAQNNLAVTLQAAGKFDAAEQRLKEMVNFLGRTPYELDKAMVQINLGSLYFNQKQWAKAESALRKADSSYLRQSGHIYYKAATAQSLGNVLLKQGRLSEAKIYLCRATTLWRQIENDLELANSLETLGELYVAQGKIETGIPLYRQAVALLNQFPDNARARKLQREFKRDLKCLLNKVEAEKSISHKTDLPSAS